MQSARRYRVRRSACVSFIHRQYIKRSHRNLTPYQSRVPPSHKHVTVMTTLLISSLAENIMSLSTFERHYTASRKTNLFRCRSSSIGSTASTQNESDQELYSPGPEVSERRSPAVGYLTPSLPDSPRMFSSPDQYRLIRHYI